MVVACEAFMDYAYEGDVKLSPIVHIQNALTKVIEALKKFVLKIRGLKTEHVVPRKALEAYRKLSKHCLNSIQQCKQAIQSNSSPNVTFREPFETIEYKTLFSDEVKKKTSPGEYVKIQSSDVLGSMNGAISVLSSAKIGLRSLDKEKQPHMADAFAQMINYSKFMLKISNRVLSYKNMYVEKKHLETTPVDPDDTAKEAYIECEESFDVALELFGLFKKKPKVASTSEAKRLELEIRKKVLKHLQDEVKEYNYNNKYKDAACSYPSMKLALSKNGIQITTAKYGIMEPKDWPKHIKDVYYTNRSYDKTYDQFPEEFNNQWYYDLINEGCWWCRDSCSVPDNFILQVWDGDSMKNEIYIEVFEKL